MYAFKYPRICIKWKQITVYPKPSQGFIAVKLLANYQNIFNYELTDILEKNIKTVQMYSGEQINIENSQSGTYQLNIHVEGKIVTSKILKE